MLQGDIVIMYIQEHLYDILPGMELTPTNPFTLKAQSVKNASQVTTSSIFFLQIFFALCNGIT
jgi:hypothetical protein